jgi:phosphatidylglycerophosphate synthase
MTTRWRPADALTSLRLLLVPLTVVLALLGLGRLVGVGLVVAGLTDFLDGPRAHPSSKREHCSAHHEDRQIHRR